MKCRAECSRSAPRQEATEAQAARARKGVICRAASLVVGGQQHEHRDYMGGQSPAGERASCPAPPLCPSKRHSRAATQLAPSEGQVSPMLYLHWKPWALSVAQHVLLGMHAVPQVASSATRGTQVAACWTAAATQAPSSRTAITATAH